MERHAYTHSVEKEFTRKNFIMNPDFVRPLKHPKKEQYLGFDLFKGFLLILVVTYHAIAGNIHRNQMSFWILTFTMPLFSSISGYLINEKYIAITSYYEIFNKYWERMIRDWLLVWTAMYVIDVLMGLKVASFRSFVYNLVFPGYHLWYIPALMLYITLFWALKKLNLRDGAILAVSIGFSLGFGLFGLYYIVPTYWNTPYSILHGIYSGLKPHYFGFFILGWYIRKHSHYEREQKFHFFRFIMWTGFVILLGARIVMSLDFVMFYTFDFFLLNYCAIVLLFPIIKHVVLHKNLIINRFLKWMSDNSLYIYLYHGMFVYLRYI